MASLNMTPLRRPMQFVILLVLAAAGTLSGCTGSNNLAGAGGAGGGGAGGGGNTGGGGDAGGGAGTTGAGATTGSGGTTGAGGISSDGGAGIGGSPCSPSGTGGTGGFGGTTVAVPECDGDGGCGDGGVCFAVTAEHRVCATVMPAQTQINDAGPVGDQCGHPGAPCPSGQECRRQRIALGAAAGAPSYANRCGKDECARNEDCPAGQVCQAPIDFAFSTTTFNAFFVCVAAECRRNADCACGECKIGAVYAEQNANRYVGPTCR